MSKLLGEHLIAAKKITEEQLLKVLERQITEGSRLGTNLIELGYITEEELTHFLAEKFGLPIVPQAILAQIPPEVLQSVPRWIAIQYELIPFAREEKVLRLAVADPTSIPEISTFPEFKSYELQFHVASEIRIQYFLKKYYRADAKPRLVSLLQKERKQQRSNSNGHQNGNGIEPSEASLYLELAKKDLLLVQDRDQAVKTLMKYLALFLERVYCFSIKQGKLHLWMSIPEEESLSLTVAIEELPLFQEVIQKKTFYDGPIITSGMEKLIQALDIQFPPQVVIIPMLIKDHVVSIIYGDNFLSRREIHQVPIIKKLVAKTAMALEILILRKKIVET